ncbi:OmpH family outer membrane protein [Polaribacter sp.]|uniref:OmpH family outer membrane protein n=1 Tax=Polaribacter sp. TaxID=1920175 RepID=UPI003F6C340F
MKLKITLLLTAFLCINAIAQTKVGTIDSNYIINIMPEAKTVVKMTQDYGAKLDSIFVKKVDAFKVKLNDYKAKEKEMGELEKKVVQKELNELDQNIQKYQKNGNTLMGLKKDELMRPLYKKLNNAINEIAKQNGYTQILTISGNQFAYIDEKFDITDLVIKKLGIVIPKEEK